MRDNEYRAWLETQELAPRSIGTKMSDARRVDQAHGDLDAHYRDDQMASLLATFAYTSADAASGRPNPTALTIDGNIYKNLASYRSALTTYRRFCEAQEHPSGRLSGLDRAAILAAIEACDAAGSPDAFVGGMEDRGLPNRYWLVHAGRRYPSKAIVHWAMREQGIDASAGGSLCKTTLEELGFVVIDWPELQRARDNFLRQMTGFRSFRETVGAYWDIERRSKNQLIENARAIAASGDDDRTAGGGIYRILVGGQQGVPLNWRTLPEVQSAERALTDRFYNALGQLVRSEAPAEEAIAFAARELEALRDAGIAGLRRGEVLSIPITVWATLHPEEASWFKIAKIEEMGRRFFGRRLFPQNDFREADLAEWLQLMRALLGLLDKEFGWEPQDLFDVQGFVWVALGGNEPKYPDADTWSHFDWHEGFKVARAGWTDQESQAFRNFVEQCHAQGLDIFFYATRPYELVIGRREAAETRASERFGLIQRSPPVFIPVDGTGRVFRLTEPDVVEIAGRCKIENAGRDGHWPNVWRGHSDLQANNEERAEMAPVNLILYGPPGTGKTFRTMEEAVRLCGEHPSAVRSELSQQYERLRKDGRIEFVTFHQNFSYEDFVEGLRPPVASEDGQADTDEYHKGLSLSVHPGIFRDLAQRAVLDRGSNAGSALDPKRSVFKIALGEKGSEEDEIRQALDANEITLGWGGTIDWSDPKYDEFSAILNRWQADVDPDATGKDANVEQLYALRAWMQEGDYVVVSDGRDRFRALGEVTSPYEFHADAERHPHRRRVRWLWRDDSGEDRGAFYPKWFRRHSVYRLDPAAIDWTALARLVNEAPDENETTSNAKPYVLVIDEINRANISKVFGELITLIEPDKRLGQPNALKVRLPYSKREFGVPSNLHIIGTMNTADRSIALLDTALRRRFRFEEIAPDTSVPAFQQAEADSGLPLAKVLDTMNQRIEYLVDRDHLIGHAFFIGCDTKAKVDAVMRDKVIPLLQEYFFDDWNRLAAVLGEKDKGGNFLDCSEIKDPMGEGQPIKSWRVKQVFDEGAYHRLVSGKAMLASVEAASDDEAIGEPK